MTLKMQCIFLKMITCKKQIQYDYLVSFKKISSPQVKREPESPIEEQDEMKEEMSRKPFEIKECKETKMQ